MGFQELIYAKVYEMRCISDPTLFYIGATTYRYLSSRKSVHCALAAHNSNLFHATMKKKGRLNNWEIKLLEQLEDCKSKEELAKREQYYIKKYKPNLNTRNAYKVA